MLQTIDFKGARVINAAASFFRYEFGSANGEDEGIRVRADGQDLGIYWPGDAVELPALCNSWEIVPNSAVTKGVIRLGVGRVNSARLVGSVEVIDTAKSTTMQNLAFVSTMTATGGAGQFGTVQIWNPGNTGKRLIIEEIGLFAAPGVSVAIGWNAASVGTVQAAVGSKLAGGAQSSVSWRQKQDHAADPFALLTVANFAIIMGASGFQSFTPKRPIVIPPGFGFLVACRTAAASITVMPELIEESAN